jgi:methyl-accepting chemotaxis protein
MVQLSEGAEQTRQVVSEFNRVVEQLTDAVHVLQKEVSKFELDSGEHSEA